MLYFSVSRGGEHFVSPDELVTNCEHRLTASILHLDSISHFMFLDWEKIKI